MMHVSKYIEFRYYNCLLLKRHHATTLLKILAAGLDMLLSSVADKSAGSDYIRSSVSLPS